MSNGDIIMEAVSSPPDIEKMKLLSNDEMTRYLSQLVLLRHKLLMNFSAAKITISTPTLILGSTRRC